MSQLHYLHEQQTTGKERFVYYCTGCNCILRVRRDLGPASEIIDSLGGRCIGCGQSLEGGIECRLAPVPDEWSDVYLSTIPALERKASPFRKASSFPHFSLGFPRLDSLLRPFARENFYVLRGQTSSMVAELAAFRAQLPYEQGGLDSAVFFVDGGNRSDPYLFSSFARQRRLIPSTVMRRVATCRVFTFYQLADLLSRHLAKAALDYGTSLVVISDLLGTFNEPELDEREARRVLSAVEEGVRETKKNALVLATLPSPNKYDDMISSWADALVNLSPSRGVVQAELVKHRNRLPAISTFKVKELLKVVS